MESTSSQEAVIKYKDRDDKLEEREAHKKLAKQKGSSRAASFVPKAATNTSADLCHCTLHCPTKFKESWMAQLQVSFRTKNDDDQRLFIVQYSTKEGNDGDYTYYLPDIEERRIHVCKKFFLRLLKIGAVRVDNLLKQTAVSSLVPATDGRGKWSRDREWDGKVDRDTWVDWMNSQPRQLSHFSRAAQVSIVTILISD